VREAEGASVTETSLSCMCKEWIHDYCYIVINTTVQSTGKCALRVKAGRLYSCHCVLKGEVWYCN